MSIFAKAGHQIYDVDGKLFATVARDISIGQNGIWPSDFEFVDADKQYVVGEPLPRAIALFVLNGPQRA